LERQPTALAEEVDQPVPPAVPAVADDKSVVLKH